MPDPRGTRVELGHGRRCRREPFLPKAVADTNVLAYRFDPRFPDKQRIATDLLRRGIAEELEHDRNYGTVRVVDPFRVGAGRASAPPSAA